ncbi:MAG: nicotinate-nucleotide adenylyltransferase [bacterium]|jgi:nicotinate-nucleotide adenylyltransferase
MRRVPLSKQQVRRLGILGGSFDPIHNGHLLCAEQLSEAVSMDRVLFIPCSRSPHKSSHVPAGDEHRMAMVRLAVRDHPLFEVSDIEILRGGVSYTVDTVRHFREKMGPDVEIWLLLGMDAYLDIPAWKDPDIVLSECRFAVARRPGCEERRLSADFEARTRFEDITAVDISSTGIRERLQEGKSIRYMVPDAVEVYIREWKPYPSAGSTQGEKGH